MHPPHTRGSFHRRLQPLYTEKHKVLWCGFQHNRSPMQHSCSHYTATCNRVNKRTESRTHEQPLVAEHRGGTDSTLKRPQPHPPHTRGTFHRRLLSLYKEKHEVSCSCLLAPQHKPHATFMQPLHCDLQQGQQTHRIRHTWTTTRCRTQGNRFDLETTPAAPAAHTRYLSSPAAVTLHGKTRGFVLRLSHPTQAPCNIHAAITLRPATESTNAQNNHAHMNNHSLQNTEEEPIRPWNDPSRTRRTHEVPFIAGCCHFTRKNTRFRAPAFPPTQAPCNSHYTTICNRVNKRTESRTHEQPLVAEHRGTDSTLKRPQPHPPHTRGTFHRRLLSLYTEKHEVSCSGFPTQHKPHATFMLPLYSDLQQGQQTHRITHTWTTTRCRTQRNRFDLETTPAAPAAHTRYFSSPASHFTRKNTRFRAPAFPPTQAPVNLHDLHSDSTVHRV